MSERWVSPSCRGGAHRRCGLDVMSCACDDPSCHSAVAAVAPVAAEPVRVPVCNNCGAHWPAGGDNAKPCKPTHGPKREHRFPCGECTAVLHGDKEVAVHWAVLHYKSTPESEVLLETIGPVQAEDLDTVAIDTLDPAHWDAAEDDAAVEPPPDEDDEEEPVIEPERDPGLPSTRRSAAMPPERRTRKVHHEPKIELVREDPATKKKKTSADAYATVLDDLRQQEDYAWYRIATYNGWHAGSSVRTTLAKTHVDIEFTARRLEEGGSAIYARLRREWSPEAAVS